MVRDKINLVEKESHAYDQKIQLQSERSQKVMEAVMKVKEQLVHQIKGFVDTTMEQLSGATFKVDKMQESVERAVNMVATQRQDLNNMDARVGQAHFKVTSLDQEFQRLKHEAVLQTEYRPKIQKLSSYCSKALFQSEDVHNNLMTTDNYLEKYLPLKIQNMVSETC